MYAGLQKESNLLLYACLNFLAVVYHQNLTACPKMLVDSQNELLFGQADSEIHSRNL